MGESADNVHEVSGWAAQDTSGHLAPFKFSRRVTGPNDVRMKVLYCGICHSDYHQIHNDWKSSTYPMVPGHEIVGVVKEVGSEVDDFEVGQQIGVGCLVRSCLSCHSCSEGLEQFCPSAVFTYNSFDIDGKATQGGYSTELVCDRKFVLRMPPNLPLESSAPLLCAGITVYSPMKHFGMTEEGKSFGVVGLGGLGHMAVKIAKAFKLKVTVFSTSPSKEQEARSVLGADDFIVTTDDKNMKAAENTIDYIIDTVACVHPLDPYLRTLKTNGKLILVGIPEQPLQLSPISVIFGRRFVGGSLIGGIAETQEMLDFCGKHNITCMTEKIPISYVNTAMERLIKNDVKYRFVIDIGTTLTEENDIGNTLSDENAIENTQTEKNGTGNTPTDDST